MSNAVQEAIKAAQQQSSQAVATVDKAAGGAVQSYQAPAKKYELDDLDNGSLAVDGFIQAKFEGLSFKMQDESLTKGTTIVEEALVTLTLGEDLTVFKGAKYGNKPTTYIKTFDGVKEARSGQSWESAMAKAKLADPNAYEYTGADIAMVAYEDIKDVKGKLVVPAGTSIGHSTTPTGLKSLKALRKAIETAGLVQDKVIVKITNTPTSKGGNDWGILTFELIGEAPAQAD